MCLSLLPYGFLFFRPTNENCLRGRKKLIFIQTNTPACLFVNGDFVIFDRE